MAGGRDATLATNRGNQGRGHIREESILAVRAADFLAGFDFAAVNAELHPLVRMTAPGDWQRVTIGDWPIGRGLFDSWILLFGILPIDRHRFGLVDVSPARGFHEQSTSLVMRSWRHQRWVEDLGESCRVIDLVEFECRLSPLTKILLPIYRFVFRHRHHNLRRRYGEPA